MNKGMSSIVSTLLLILLIFVVMGAAVILINSSLFKTQKEASVNRECSSVNIVVADFCYESQAVTNILTGVVSPKEFLKFDIKNDQSTSLKGLLLQLQYENGNKVPLAILGGGNVNGSQISTLTTDFIDNVSGISTVYVLPQVVVNNETIVCKNDLNSFNWSDIAQCPISG